MISETSFSVLDISVEPKVEQSLLLSEEGEGLDIVADAESQSRSDVLEGVVLNEDYTTSALSDDEDSEDDGIRIIISTHTAGQHQRRKSLQKGANKYVKVARPELGGGDKGVEVEEDGGEDYENEEQAFERHREEVNAMRFRQHLTSFDIDIENLEDKPWRQFGVDLALYFNYGFNEDSWQEYTEKQLRLRMQDGKGPLARQANVRAVLPPPPPPPPPPPQQTQQTPVAPVGVPLPNMPQFLQQPPTHMNQAYYGLPIHHQAHFPMPPHAPFMPEMSPFQLNMYPGHGHFDPRFVSGQMQHTSTQQPQPRATKRAPEDNFDVGKEVKRERRSSSRDRERGRLGRDADGDKQLEERDMIRRSRDIDNEKGKGKDPDDREKERSRDRGRDTDKGDMRDRDRDRDRDKGRERDRDRNRDRNIDNDKDRGRDRDRDSSRGKDKESSSHSRREASRDRVRDIDPSTKSSGRNKR